MSARSPGQRGRFRRGSSARGGDVAAPPAATAAAGLRRRWPGRLALAVLVPLGLLALLEGGLRLGGYGYRTDFLLPVAGGERYGPNQRFGWRFFPPRIARTPIFFNLEAEKPPRTYRVVILGASAAFGVPDAAFSFARQLEAMLNLRFPGVRFEFLNTSIVATNSHVTLPIARDCARFDPDLFIVYLGNNEVIGPYGLGSTVTGSIAGLQAIRLSIWLRTLRTGQLIQRLIGRFSGRDQQYDQWRGMSMFAEREIAADDPRLQKVYGHYARNLRDICAVAARAGAGVLLCTVATNLRDCAPFASLNDAGLTETERQHWQRFYEAGNAAADSGRPAAALARWQEALAIDGHHAELQWRRGRALLALGRFEEARAAFQRARDLDTYRFRADSRLNAIVRRLAGELASQGVGLVDCAGALAASPLCPDRIPGDEFFYEHVHLRFAGNGEIARAIYPSVVARLPAWATDRGDPAAPPPTQDECASWLAYTDWNQYLMLTDMRQLIDKRPFTGQLDHARDLRDLQQEQLALRQQASPEVQQQTFRLYQETVQKRPGDLLLRINWVRLLRQTGQEQAAEREWESLVSTQPRPR
jgi:tetratricopeptide (TPR) repeat protein